MEGREAEVLATGYLLPPCLPVRIRIGVKILSSSLRPKFVVCFELLLHLFRHAVLQMVPFHFQELNFLSACDDLPLLLDAPDACVHGP